MPDRGADIPPDGRSSFLLYGSACGHLHFSPRDFHGFRGILGQPTTLRGDFGLGPPIRGPKEEEEEEEEGDE